MQNEMRDRLIGLISQGAECDEYADCNNCKYSKEVNCLIAKCADHLIANGVILPPCKVGQLVWEVYKWFTGKVEVREGKVSMLQQKADKTWKIRVSINSSVYDIPIDKIGKNIFLSREAAEKRQEELKNG